MFDDLDVTIRQRFCEALYAAGRIKEAGESLLNIVNTDDEDVYMTGPVVTWVSGKLCYLFLRYDSTVRHRFLATMSLHCRKQ